MEHISLGLGQEQMQAFWESFQWALETTLADEWKDKSGNDTALATGDECMNSRRGLVCCSRHAIAEHDL